MKINNEILILNTGGTFNKYYDPIKGELKVNQNNNFIEDIIIKSKIDSVQIEGILYKDSLELDDDDRTYLKEYILKTKYKKIIVIHGTDTMDQSAKVISQFVQDKMVVFTGAMKPFTIESVEAVSNLMSAYGYLSNTFKAGVFISMHGMIKEHHLIKKNKELGVFECLN